MKFFYTDGIAYLGRIIKNRTMDYNCVINFLDIEFWVSFSTDEDNEIIDINELRNLNDEYDIPSKIYSKDLWTIKRMLYAKIDRWEEEYPSPDKDDNITSFINQNWN